MAEIVYTVSEDSPENIAGFEQYSEQDKALVNSFQINSIFDTAKNYSELHILSLSDELLESIYNYTNFKELGNAQSAGQTGASVLTIDPIADSKAYGYDIGGIKLLYHFLDDLYTQDTSTIDFYIQDISQDRTEISLATLALTPEELTSATSTIKTNLQSQSYFTGFRLNFKNNDLFIGTNIDTLDSDAGKVVVVKLYEPLPTTYGIKSTLNIVDTVSDSVAYEVDSEIIIAPEAAPTLRSPNFNIEIGDESVIPTQYYNYNELFSYPINNANSQIYSTVSEKGIDISVDYSTFSDFIHFSSAQERLLNFKYKLDLVTSYSASIASIGSATTGLQGVSGSRTYYENLLTGVVDNFDHYERFLYYESGSDSWPKSNTTKPYINKISTDAESIIWYTDQINNAIEYDLTNYNSLVYSIPTYLRDDSSNENYLTFVYMVGQHFDNLWLYSKAVTDKYDADNRINKGISKDLVAEALKNFGVKLYTSNKSTEDLFSTFIGQAYQSGSEIINSYITGSLTGSNTPIQPTSYDDYQKQVQKRMYHNLPLLLKSKGTERGLRALINCFGIPGDILDIKLYGGRNTNERPFFGDYQAYTSSLDKIRLDNTGSIVTGSTLSNYTSIVKRDQKYTDDLHAVQVGFSPTDNIDKYIISQSASTFNIDEYLGNPANLTLDNYQGLDRVSQTLLGSLDQYNLQDYVRLIKFFDNVVFKTVKDFIPARVSADTGIIIKPNLLNKSKAKSVTLSGTRPEHTSSIDTAFIEGTNAGAFGINDEYDTRYVDRLVTPLGAGVRYSHAQQEPKFNGELANSGITVTTGELNTDNLFKLPVFTDYLYNIRLWQDTTAVCLFSPGTTDTFYVTSSTQLFTAGELFFGTNINTVYTSSAPGTGAEIYPQMPISFSGYSQYQSIPVSASNGIVNASECKDQINVVYGVCNITQNSVGLAIQQLTQNQPYQYQNWFDIPLPQLPQNIQYYIDGQLQTSSTYTPTSGQIGTTVTFEVVDTGLGNACKLTKTVNIGVCELLERPTPSKFTPGEELVFSFQQGSATYLATYFTGFLPNTNYVVKAYPQLEVEGPYQLLYAGLNSSVIVPLTILGGQTPQYITIEASNGSGCIAITTLQNYQAIEELP